MLSIVVAATGGTVQAPRAPEKPFKTADELAALVARETPAGIDIVCCESADRRSVARWIDALACAPVKASTLHLRMPANAGSPADPECIAYAALLASPVCAELAVLQLDGGVRDRMGAHCALMLLAHIPKSVRTLALFLDGNDLRMDATIGCLAHHDLALRFRLSARLPPWAEQLLDLVGLRAVDIEFGAKDAEDRIAALSAVLPRLKLFGVRRRVALTLRGARIDALLWRGLAHTIGSGLVTELALRNCVPHHLPGMLDCAPVALFGCAFYSSECYVQRLRLDVDTLESLIGYSSAFAAAVAAPCVRQWVLYGCNARTDAFTRVIAEHMLTATGPGARREEVAADSPLYDPATPAAVVVTKPRIGANAQSAE